MHRGAGQRQPAHDLGRRQDRVVEEELQDVERTARGGDGAAHDSAPLSVWWRIVLGL